MTMKTLEMVNHDELVIYYSYILPNSGEDYKDKKKRKKIINFIDNKNKPSQNCCFFLAGYLEVYGKIQVTKITKKKITYIWNDFCWILYTSCYNTEVWKICLRK